MNSNTTNEAQPGGRKSARELRDQVMRDIQRVREDVDEIKHRMTPGQIIDDAIFYRRLNSTPLSTYDLLKANPIGTSFLTLGTLLLMQDENSQGTYESLAWRQAEALKARVGGVVDDTKSRVDKLHASVKSHLPQRDPQVGQAPNKLDLAKAKINAAKDTVQSRAQDLRHGIDSAKHRIQDGIDEAKHKFSNNESSENPLDSFESGRFNDDQLLSGGTLKADRTSEFGENVRDNLNSAANSVKDTAGSLKDSARSAIDTVRDQSRNAIEGAKHLDPLTYMVLGAGLGTLTGAALPVVRAENERVDDLLEEKVVQFKSELETAINESINTLKNEFIGGVTDVNFNIF